MLRKQKNQKKAKRAKSNQRLPDQLAAEYEFNQEERTVGCALFFNKKDHALIHY